MILEDFFFLVTAWSYPFGESGKQTALIPSRNEASASLPRKAVNTQGAFVKYPEEARRTQVQRRPVAPSRADCSSVNTSLVITRNACAPIRVYFPGVQSDPIALAFELCNQFEHVPLSIKLDLTHESKMPGSTGSWGGAPRGSAPHAGRCPPSVSRGPWCKCPRRGHGVSPATFFSRPPLPRGKRGTEGVMGAKPDHSAANYGCG